MNETGQLPAELALLEPFIGTWHTVGQIIAADPDAEMELRGTDSYEWLPGNFFVIHRVDVLMGNHKNQTIEIIGFNANTKKYFLSYFDNKGNRGEMEATFENGQWKVLSKKLRFTGDFNKDRTILSGTWEIEDANQGWTKWMDITLTKQI